jgi:AraC family transcriptional regulator, melibiose operon regulatory protein
MKKNDIDVDESFQELTSHGMLDYPVRVYYVDLLKMYMGSIRWHWHDELEIDIINSGEAVYHIGETTVTVQAGQAIIINQNVMHSIEPAQGKKCTLYTIVFNPSYIVGFGQSFLAVKYLTPLLTRENTPYYIFNETIEWQEKIIDTCNSIIAVNLTQKYGYELLTKSYLCQLWVDLLARIMPSSVATKEAPSLKIDEARVKKALVFIEAHYPEQLSLEDIASSIHLSKSECCRCFKRVLDLTPFEYLLRYRIFEASKRIMGNDPVAESIAALSTSVGFNNTSYFNKLFKKYLGFTPSYYKKLVKMDPNVMHPTLGVPLAPQRKKI